MHLLRLEADHFRNLAGSVDCSPGLNLLYGANAQGKSNWLEAIYVLATTKSFRTPHPQEMIRHGVEAAVLRGRISRGHLIQELQLLLTSSNKQTFVNGKREAVARYLGILEAVAFTAAEMEVVRGAPEARRRFLDRGIVSTQPAYLATLAEYNRILKQKNRLLRDASEAADPASYFPLIQSWNDQLVVSATEIHQARTAYVERLRAALNPQLFQAEEITINYRSSLADKGDLSDYSGLLQERLLFHLRNEIASGHSLVGPHRDDLQILCDGYELARFGSSGQQRSALLILDLAQIMVYHRVFDEYPVFLIDDIDAELDGRRIEILLDYLEGKTQTFVSTSKRSLANRYRHRANTLLVKAGRVMAEAQGTVGAEELLRSDREVAETESQAEPALGEDESKHHAPF
jgi:DNA replication and repair protein RecF